ncbi:sel1 repeat family protein [Bradyrhizobium australiense]|uniref:Sel1 repeat family protein n=1 Tax=Bradyrhizobium australiense TaxID=2721161 RepID=A0A7Y4GP73_9BRAD|nr:sel1 repeat family protein [Bradyrhizobium australiense]NOJ39384.1 sel1 repeat family protein [Bradyrhizobium australiense]
MCDFTGGKGAPVRQQEQEAGAGDARRLRKVMGSITMVENTRPVQARDPFDRFDEAISDPRLYEADQSRYEQLRYEQPRYEQPQYEQSQYEQPQYAQPFAPSFERTDVLPDELPPHEPVPLFLSNYEEESHQQLSEYTFGSGRFGSGGLKKARAGRIVTGVVVVSAIAAVLALFSIDSTRAVIFNASLGGGVGSAPPAAQLAAAVPEPAPQPRVAAPPLAAEPSGAEMAAARRTPPTALASASPTRDEITAAYQSALKGKVAVPEPVAREAAREASPATPVAAVAPAVREPVPVAREVAPARRIDPDELAALLNRAKSLLAIGDITSARLLLERAADAQEVEAALMLAGTYDPQVLGSQDLRSVTPDPAQAKLWYQKAAQLGSADARRRLGQLQN